MKLSSLILSNNCAAITPEAIQLQCQQSPCGRSCPSVLTFVPVCSCEQMCLLGLQGAEKRVLGRRDAGVFVRAVRHYGLQVSTASHG